MQPLPVTLTTLGVKDGELRDADIEFDAVDYFWTTVDEAPCAPGGKSTQCVVDGLRNTLTQEIGHAMGLDHVSQEDEEKKNELPNLRLRDRLNRASLFKAMLKRMGVEVPPTKMRLRDKGPPEDKQLKLAV